MAPGVFATAGVVRVAQFSYRGSAPAEPV